MTYKGNELHNGYENEIVLEWLEVKSSLSDITGLASRQDLNNLARQLAEVVEQYSPRVFKSIVARTVIDWVEDIDAPPAISNEGGCLLPPEIEWLVNKMAQDRRTNRISLASKTGSFEIWVCAEGHDGDTQYDYSGYLIEAMGEFGYFAADVIVYSPQSGCPPSGAVEIYPRGE